MSPKTIKGALVPLMLTLALTTACGDASESTDTTGKSESATASGTATIPDSDPRIDYTSVSAVCEAFARTIFTRDAAADTHPDDAYLRARPYVTYERYDQLTRQPRTRTSPQWDIWRQHAAKTTVTLEPFTGDVSPPGSGQRAHAALVSVTPIGQDGWVGPGERHAVHCELISQNTQWRVVGYDIEDLDAA